MKTILNRTTPVTTPTIASFSTEELSFAYSAAYDAAAQELLDFMAPVTLELCSWKGWSYVWDYLYEEEQDAWNAFCFRGEEIYPSYTPEEADRVLTPLILSDRDNAVRKALEMGLGHNEIAKVYAFGEIVVSRWREAIGVTEDEAEEE